MPTIINSLSFGNSIYVLTLPYATCSTAATTAAKVATIANNNWSLETGSRVSVKFNNANTSTSAPTLNVNSSGAKTIKHAGATIDSTQYWGAGAVIDFVYDGDSWNILGCAKNYSAGSGISLSGTTFSNSGVRSITQDATDGHILSINTGGTTTTITTVDTKVTSASNHYTPSAASGSELTVDALSSTAATWGTTSLVTGVNIQRDAKGHVTGVTVDSIQMPANPDTDTTYTFNGAVSTIKDSNLTASRALVSNSSGKIAVSAVTSTELGYLDGVTSKIQTQLDGKQATLTGAATTITGSNLTASRALISDSSGKVAVSTVTSTELGYLDGVTSNVQTQLNTLSGRLTWQTF